MQSALSLDFCPKKPREVFSYLKGQSEKKKKNKPKSHNGTPPTDAPLLFLLDFAAISMEFSGLNVRYQNSEWNPFLTYVCFSSQEPQSLNFRFYF